MGFHRALKGISKNEAVEVVCVEAAGLGVRTAAGAMRRIDGKHAKSFDVLEARAIEVSSGDRLLLTANWRDQRLRTTNGELVTVSAVDSAGRIQLQDGRTLPANYRSLTHGYAVTAHRSQGKSVDSVIISADGMQKELFYVAASRGRESVTVITSDKERLKETVARTMARKSASELIRSNHQVVVRLGTHRGLEMARRLVRRAAELITSIPKRLVRQALAEPRKERQHGRSVSR